MDPLVTVGMALYDGARYVVEAVESARAQTHPAVELIVVDDGSSDGGPDVVERSFPDVRVIRQAHRGIGAARNRAVREATGAYLAFLDADDRWPADRLEAQVRALETQPELDGVFGAVDEFTTPDLDAESLAQLRVPVHDRPARLVITSLLRLSAFRRVGPFDEAAGRAVDVDWVARADEQGLAWGSVPDVVTQRRLHQWNTGLRQRGGERDYIRVVHAALQRRRGESGRTP